MNALLQNLRRELDRFVIGHDEVKEALLTAVVCREHIYLEGPPGTAKTRMAEIVARGSKLKFFFYQLHRDTRLTELLGDVVLERRILEDGQGETIHQRIEKGGILAADVCVLDDISRAPGEALNVLLRILNERSYAESNLPLMTAIATSNPHLDEYYNEPLDPACLDRFTIQLQVSGLIQSGDQEAARAVIERFASGTIEEVAAPTAHGTRADYDALYDELQKTQVGDRIKRALLEFLRVLVEHHGCDETNSLLTDRSFLVKAIKLLRGSAVLAGRGRVTVEDLAVLRWMTTFRVPADVRAEIPALIARIQREYGD